MKVEGSGRYDRQTPGLIARCPGGMYLNFPGFLEEGQEMMRDAYGENYDRLVALKNEYDPTNFFRMNQNVRPTR